MAITQYGYIPANRSTGTTAARAVKQRKVVSDVVLTSKELDNIAIALTRDYCNNTKEFKYTDYIKFCNYFSVLAPKAADLAVKFGYIKSANRAAWLANLANGLSAAMFV